MRSIPLDVGLATHGLGLDAGELRHVDILRMLDGRLAEMFVGQELRPAIEAKNATPLHFWVRESARANAEVDFLVPVAGTAVPVEVKSGSIYTDGGRLYAFDSQTRFGIFIIRKDSSIYVPTAFDKLTYTNFGDNWNQGWSSSGTHSMLQIPQMTVSPDGRFAAVKLKRTFSRLENAGSTKIVVFSLTGETPVAWGGLPYRVVDTGSSGASSTGQYQFASSLTLTNQHLYYMIERGVDGAPDVSSRSPPSGAGNTAAPAEGAARASAQADDGALGRWFCRKLLRQGLLFRRGAVPAGTVLRLETVWCLQQAQRGGDGRVRRQIDPHGNLVTQA